MVKLPPVGVALLLFAAERLSIPRPEQAEPGVRSTAYRGDPDVVLIEAVGYDDVEGQTVIARAAQACIDADLRVDQAGDASPFPHRLVRRS